MNFKEALKKFLYPARVLLGRFAISPLEERVNNLEIIFTDTQMRNALIYKTAAFVAADKIEGDYLEFGVYTGRSFAMAFKCLREAFKDASTPNIWNTTQDCDERSALWERMRFFAFDSFQGLPGTIGLDALSRDFTGGKFACSEDDFKKNIASEGVPLDRVVAVPGWFDDTVNDDTWAKYDIKSAAIVYIDSDLYESAKTILNSITPILVDGTVIIFDDWYNFKGNPELGEQRAFKEWQEAHPELTLIQYQKEGPWKNSFIVQRSSDMPTRR